MQNFVNLEKEIVKAIQNRSLDSNRDFELLYPYKDKDNFSERVFSNLMLANEFGNHEVAFNLASLFLGKVPEFKNNGYDFSFFEASNKIGGLAKSRLNASSYLNVLKSLTSYNQSNRNLQSKEFWQMLKSANYVLQERQRCEEYRPFIDTITNLFTISGDLNRKGNEHLQSLGVNPNSFKQIMTASQEARGILFSNSGETDDFLDELSVDGLHGYANKASSAYTAYFLPLFKMALEEAPEFDELKEVYLQSADLMSYTNNILQLAKELNGTCIAERILEALNQTPENTQQLNLTNSYNATIENCEQGSNGSQTANTIASLGQLQKATIPQTKAGATSSYVGINPQAGTNTEDISANYAQADTNTINISSIYAQADTNAEILSANYAQADTDTQADNFQKSFIENGILACNDYHELIENLIKCNIFKSPVQNESNREQDLCQ